jgi:hypothetical protein
MRLHFVHVPFEDSGPIEDGVELQARYAAALGITAHADAAGFRAAELTRRPPLDA